MEKFRRARRRFLQTLTLAVIGLPLWRFLAPEAPAGQAVLRLKKAEVPPDGALVFRQARVAVLRAGEDIYALSLACTHLGCTVTVTPTELVCPCHGSAFARTGEALRGPASAPLTRLRVLGEGDELVVMS
ncbi:MAG: Rieske (2Fe-2S) protein [Desulfuromonadales bacterium]|jgi:Rieske Fe-S protein